MSMLDGLSDAEKRKLLAYASKYEQDKKRDQLHRLYWGTAEEGHVGGPYPKQKLFHDLGAQYRERAIFGGNRCIPGRQLVDLWGGGVKAAKDVVVGELLVGWDQELSKTIPVVVSEVVCKPSEPILRISFSHNHVLECAAKHRLLTTRGWMDAVSCVRSIENELDRQTVRALNDLRSSRRELDFQSDCSVYCGLDGAPPLLAQVGGQDSFPLLGDAQGCSHSCERLDENLYILGYSHLCPQGGRQSTRHGHSRFLGQIAESLSHVSCIASLPLQGECEEPRQLFYESRDRSLRAASVHFDLQQSVSFIDPYNPGLSCYITNCEVLSQEILYDFVVPDYNNYVASGLVQHNSGKSRTCAAEVSCHVTGIYPPWWEGRRAEGPNNWIVASVSNELTRDICQEALLGPMQVGEKAPSGTGWIPYNNIVFESISYRQCGIPNVCEAVKVRWAGGGFSEIVFKSFEQEHHKYQGTSKWGFWLSEELNDRTIEIYTECTTRILDQGGIGMWDRTPLIGMSPIVQHFMEPKKGVTYVSFTWDDCPHLDEDARRQLLESYPEHERETRSKGVPMMGTGGVFPIADEDIICDPFSRPKHFRYIWGIDIGFDHPGAGVLLGYDADADIIYVMDSYKIRGKDSLYHASAIKSRGDWIPVAWPHDGMKHDHGGGKQVAEQYRDHGVNMLERSARYDEKRGGAQPIEPGIIAMYERMLTGRWKVFNNQSDWLAEKRMYHRKDGKIVAKNDDLLSASRIALIDLKFALSDIEALRWGKQVNQVEIYDPLASY